MGNIKTYRGTPNLKPSLIGGKKKYLFMRQIGRHGRINARANRILKQKFAEAGIGYCEPKLEGCMGMFGLSFAHRHKRNWYYSQQELLWDIKEVVLACASCHGKIESNKELTEEVFQRLRE